MTTQNPYFKGAPLGTSRHHLGEHDPSKIMNLLPASAQRLLSSSQEPHSTSHSHCRLPRQTRNAQRRRWSIRGAFNLANGLILLWALVLWWGERLVFRQSIEACEWGNWERWPSDATPHHLAFVADPQLVDPHTYPGRPWPLSWFTVLHTDMYLRRSFSLMQKLLHPDTVFFLGDLFDGGREWATGSSYSPEKRYRRIGDKYWLREYNRFARIFFKHWGDGGVHPSAGQEGRKIIASLPGNHDLGIGVGIQFPVRQRFNAHFGEGNRVDVIANHTFVSVDTVSLSAKAQQGEGLLSQENIEKIFRPTQDFLDGVQSAKRRAVAAEIKRLNGEYDGIKQKHTVISGLDQNLKSAQHPTMDPGPEAPEFPTILLTHVPLYRAPGTPCGPLREHWPPTPPPKGQAEPLEKDERNSLLVQRGYQYQNVLHQEISTELVDKIGNVSYVFSGDDHDYCEVVHKGYTGSYFTGAIREITVKSMSWAMGVRKPGFLMLSLWNPVDATGRPIDAKSSDDGATVVNSGSPTVETHLCLLPDQLSIFIRYLTLVIFTLLALLIRAALVSFGILEPYCDILEPISAKGESLLPTSSLPKLPSSPDITLEYGKSDHSYYHHNSSTEPSTPNPSGLSVRSSSVSRNRNLSSNNSYGNSTPPNGYGYGYATPPAVVDLESVNFAPPEPGSYTHKHSRAPVKIYDGRSKSWAGRVEKFLGSGKIGTLGTRSASRLQGIWVSPLGLRVRKRVRDFMQTAFVRDVKWSVLRVGWVVMLWYLWLCWNG